MPINPQILPTTPLGRTADTLAEVKRRIAVLERGSAGGGGGALGAAGGHLTGTFPSPTLNPAATPELTGLKLGSSKWQLANATGDEFRLTDLSTATDVMWAKLGDSDGGGVRFTRRVTGIATVQPAFWASGALDAATNQGAKVFATATSFTGAWANSGPTGTGDQIGKDGNQDSGFTTASIYRTQNPVNFDKCGTLNAFDGQLHSSEAEGTKTISAVGGTGTTLTITGHGYLSQPSGGTPTYAIVTLAGFTGTKTLLNGTWRCTIPDANTIVVTDSTNADIDGTGFGSATAQRHLFKDVTGSVQYAFAHAAGSTTSSSEWKTVIDAGAWCKTVGWNQLVYENNTYASWATLANGPNQTFAAGSQWIRKAATGGQIITVGPGEAGTGLTITNATGSPRFKRLFVIGCDVNTSASTVGDDLYCIGGSSFGGDATGVCVGIGAEACITQTKNTAGLGARLVIAPTTTPTAATEGIQLGITNAPTLYRAAGGVLALGRTGTGGATTYLRIIPSATNQASGIQLYDDASTGQWEVSKDSTDQFRVRDLSTSTDAIYAMLGDSDGGGVRFTRRVTALATTQPGIWVSGALDAAGNQRAKVFATATSFTGAWTNSGPSGTGDQIGKDLNQDTGLTAGSIYRTQNPVNFNKCGTLNAFDGQMHSYEVEAAVSLTGLVVSGSGKVITFPAGHGYDAQPSGGTPTNAVVTISGVTNLTLLHGTWKATVTNSTQITLPATCTNTTDGTITGASAESQRHLFKDVSNSVQYAFAHAPGSTTSCAEWKTTIDTGCWSKSVGWNQLVYENNSYASWAATTNETFATGSQWRRKAATGGQIITTGPGQAGTGLIITNATGSPRFKRLFVISSDVNASASTVGDDLLCIGGSSFSGDATGVCLGIGAEACITQTKNTSGLPSRLVIAATVSPTTVEEGMQFGTTLPASLYRCGDSSLKTAGSFGVGAATALGGAESGMFIASTGEFSTQRSSGSLWRQWGTAEDANPRFQMMFTGETRWGPGGASAVDTGLLRNGVGILQVTDGTSGGFGELRVRNFRHGMNAAGATLGFFNVAAVVRAAALTQTSYSTATRTINNLTSATLTDNTAGTANTTLEVLVGAVYTTDVVGIRNNFADLAAQVNALRVDLENVKQVSNAVIDDLQAYGLEQ